MSSDKVALWCGKRLSEMSSDELIEIISDLAKSNETLRKEVLEAKLTTIRTMADAGRRTRRWFA